LPIPAWLFCVLSLLFGGVIIAINPPLRGPDESAHFVRIYSIARGEIVPTATDDRGRRGLMIPAQIYDDFSFFELARWQLNYPSPEHTKAVEGFYRDRAQRLPNARDPPEVFQVYGGSEAYSPLPYFAYAIIAVVLQATGADFVTSVYTLRIGGLATFTAMTVYAICIAPHLKWALFLIAMLPGALYGRTVLSADGGALGALLIVVALCLRTALMRDAGRVIERSLWMTLCMAAKPAQIAFLLLEGMTGKVAEHARRWPSVALVILPGLALTALWLFAGSTEVAAWRMVEGTTLSPNEFNPAWKLRYMLEHPLHFPAAALRSLDYSYELWRQLIGVLGWLDTYLIAWAYPLLTALMLATWIETLRGDPATRRRIAFWSAASILAYTLAIFLIFYMIWTPTSEDRILGIQGRYFLVILPPLAVFIAAILDRQLPEKIVATCAVVGAFVGGASTIAAILRWP
jgi:uncharacterized membrane protein